MTTWARTEEIERNTQMLIKWSGLPEAWVRKAVARVSGHYYEREFELHAPASPEELAWWYRTSSYYLFHMASHAYWPELDSIEGGPILDYGGGLGNNFFELVRQGHWVDYFDVSLACSDFVRWRLVEEGLDECDHSIILPFSGMNGYTSASCIREDTLGLGRYGAIVMQDVLEHLPDYEVTLAHLVDYLLPGGLLFEETYFEDHGIGEHVRLRAARPLADTMAALGMESVREHLWRKVDVV